VAVDALPTKIFILNNQHLGMVVQWEDRFYKANRAHTYLGRRVRCSPSVRGLFCCMTHREGSGHWAHVT
jgi:thiamine pyrophosphate-dependent acetolactate synthase large subunit-like protein